MATPRDSAGTPRPHCVCVLRLRPFPKGRRGSKGSMGVGVSKSMGDISGISEMDSFEGVFLDGVQGLHAENSVDSLGPNGGVRPKCGPGLAATHCSNAAALLPAPPSVQKNVPFLSSSSSTVLVRPPQA